MERIFILKCWWIETDGYNAILSKLSSVLIRGLKHAASGPHVAHQMHLCGPYKRLLFDQNYVILRVFQVICGSLKLFYIKVWPAEHFSFEMCPADECELETPGLDQPQTVFCSKQLLPSPLSNLNSAHHWKSRFVLFNELLEKDFFIFVSRPTVPDQSFGEKVK